MSQDSTCPICSFQIQFPPVQMDHNECVVLVNTTDLCDDHRSYFLSPQGIQDLTWHWTEQAINERLNSTS